MVLAARQFHPHWRKPQRPEDRQLVKGGATTDAHLAISYGCTESRYGVRCACVWHRTPVPANYVLAGLYDPI